MLKGAVYSNVFLLLIMSIFFLTRIFKKNYDLKKLRKIIIIYIIFNLISSYLCISDIVDLGMNFMFLLPISIISFVMYIISICLINKKVKKSNNCNNLDIKSIILIMVPIIVFMVPYLYELWNTDQEGVHIFSNPTRIAIRVTKSKLTEVSLVGLKQYLSQNPLRVWYELATPITYQLTPYFGLPMPYAYKDGYLIMDSAYEGQTLPPEIKYKLLANRTGQITQNNIKLQNHTSKLTNLEAMLVEATLQSMYEREMMAFNLEMVNINLINLEE